MKRTPILTALALAACTQPEPIREYNAPLDGKFGYAVPETSPAPLQRRYLPCVAYPVLSDDGETLYLTRFVMASACYNVNANDGDGNGRSLRRSVPERQPVNVCKPSE